MSKLNGTNMRVLVNGTSIGGTKSFTLNLNRSNIKTSSKDSGGYTDRIYGEGDWDVTFDGLYDPALTCLTVRHSLPLRWLSLTEWGEDWFTKGMHLQRT